MAVNKCAISLESKVMVLTCSSSGFIKRAILARGHNFRTGISQALKAYPPYLPIEPNA